MGLFGRSGGKGEDPLALMQAGEFKKAVKVLEQRLKADPHDRTSKRRLAEAYEGAERPKDASDIYTSEGEALLASGDRTKGLAFLKKAAKLDPDDRKLAEKIAELEGGGSSDDAFSFDVSATEEPAAETSTELPKEETGFAMAESPALPPERGPAGSPPAVDVPAAPAVPEAGEPEPEPEPVEELPPAPQEPTPVPVQAVLEVEPLPPPEETPKIEELPTPEEVPVPEELPPPEEIPPPPEEPATRPAESDEVGLMLGAFPGLDAMDVMELIACFGCNTLQPGEVLIREGEAGEAVYLVIRGRLQAKATLGGSEVELATLTRGDVLGEVSFMHNVPRTATVTALESTVVLEMPGASAKEQLAAMPHIRDRLEKLIEERVERTLALVKERLKAHPDA